MWWDDDHVVGDNPELRRRIESNDSTLDQLSIYPNQYGEFKDQNYIPPMTLANWQNDGEAIGRNSNIKRFQLKLPEDLDKDMFRVFCLGMAKNSSIEWLMISYSKFGADIFNLLKPFFFQNETLLELTLRGKIGSSKESVTYLCEALESFSSLQSISLSMGDSPNGMEAIHQSLSGHSKLKSMKLECTPTGEEMTSLVSILKHPTSALTELRLSGFSDSSLDDISAVQLADGLKNNSSLKSLDLSSNSDVSVKGWEAIFANSLQNPQSSIEQIRLTGSSLDDASAKALSNALIHGSKSLKSLCVSNNRTIGTEGWKAIFRSLTHCRLEDLGIGCQHGGYTDEEMNCLALGLANDSMLKKLNLRLVFDKRSSSRNGWEALASILRNPNSELVELDIARCTAMNNDALAILADALRGNKKLKFMPLEWSFEDRARITNWKPLITLLCDETSIESTYDSNHTLKSLGTKSYTGVGYEESFLNRPPDLCSLFRLNRDLGPVEAARYKIINTHFSGDSIMDPFLDMDTQLLPQVMSWMARDNHGKTLLYQFIKNSSIFE